jgi:anaerobic selenocysteine-containing dehydrogenase
VHGVGEVERLVRDFTPEAVTAACGIEPATIRRLARELAGTPRAAVYGRIGTCTQEFGTLASWMVDVVNVLSGHRDRPGGMMFAKPIAWSVAGLPIPDFADGFTFHRWKSRVRGAPEVLGQVPHSCLAEEITTPGEGRIRGLVMLAGNFVISAPSAGALDAAFPQLECMISVDKPTASISARSSRASARSSPRRRSASSSRRRTSPPTSRTSARASAAAATASCS